MTTEEMGHPFRRWQPYRRPNDETVRTTGQLTCSPTQIKSQRGPGCGDGQT